VILKGSAVYCELGAYLEMMTNNQAAYHGLIQGLEFCVKHRIANLDIEGNSMLVVKQINGEWQTNSAQLRQLKATAKQLLNRISSFRIKFIDRNQNSPARQVVSEVMRTRRSFERINLNCQEEGSD